MFDRKKKYDSWLSTLMFEKKIPRWYHTIWRFPSIPFYSNSLEPTFTKKKTVNSDVKYFVAIVTIQKLPLSNQFHVYIFD